MKYSQRIVHHLLKAAGAFACIIIMLWLAKCPGGLEWWRAAALGFMIPLISRFI